MLCLVFFLSLEQARSRLCHFGCVKVLCLVFFVCSSNQDHVCAMSVASKCCVCFFKVSSKQDDVCAMSVASKCCVCFSYPLGKQDRICVMSAPPILFAPRISQKKTWIPTMSVESKCCVCFFFKSRASKITSVSCRLSQSAVSVFFLPLGKQDRACAMSAHRAPLILLAPRISRTNVDPSSKHGPVCAMSVASKWCVFFFVTLEQGRSHQSQVGLV